MGTIFIQNFKFGMDRRRKRMAGVPGTLWVGKNVVISRGGDIERAKKFDRTHTLPTSSTFGLSAVRGQLYTFGSGATPADMPADVQYQRLQSPDATAMTELLDVKTFDGKFYAIARYASGHIYHFYDGTRVSDWDTLADAAATYTTLADYFAEIINADSDVVARVSGPTITLTAKTAGSEFTLSVSETDGGGTDDQTIAIEELEANVSEVAEVRATGTVTVVAGTGGSTSNEITSVLVDGNELVSTAVRWLTSHTVTAAALAAEINNGTHGYTATSSGAVVTVSAPIGDGATANGTTLVATCTGDVVANGTSMSGGVTAVDAVAQVELVSFGGTVEAEDQFTITINNRAYVATVRASATGVSAFIHKRRMWSPANSLWYYSKLNDPSDWTDVNASTGAGFINVSSDSEGTERLVGAAAYGTQAVVFSRRNTWLYNLSTDAQDFAFAQPIENTGTMASRSPFGYGNTDVFYLDESGIRSLRAKDQTGDAYADDVGTAIDPFIREYMDSLTSRQITRAVSTVEPRDRRYWLAMGERIFVYSNFPRSQIAAWTYFEPGFEISDICRAYNQLFVRSGDFIYTYGGSEGTEYPDSDEMVPYVELPFATAQVPTMVHISGCDIGATGNWQVSLAVDPDNEASVLNVGTLVGCTFPDANIAIGCRTTHVAANITGVGSGAMSLCNLAIYHDGKEPNT